MDYPKEATWHWLLPDGTGGHGSLSDLRARLLTHTLPASTWVWSTTWTEWIPATRVAELASALQPSARRPLKKPKRDPNAQRPPAQRPNEEASRVSPAPGQGRDPLSTLADDAQFGPANVNTSTLRPPGAVPPPPRPVPQLLQQEAAKKSSAPAPLITPIPSVFIGAQPGGAPTERMSPRPDTLHELRGHGAGLHNAAPTTRPDPTTVAKTPAQVESAKAAAPAAATIEPPDVEPAARPQAKGSPRAALLTLSFACVALSISLAFALRALSVRPPAPLALGLSAAKGVSPPSVVPGCVLLVPPAKLSGSVERAVEPYFLNLSPDRVAVGFAATRTQASGLVLDLRTLDQTPVFDEASERAVLGVLPTQAEPLSFAADRDSGELRSPRSLDDVARTVLGFTEAGVATRVGGDSPALVWPTPDVPKTQPRVARVGDRHAVLFRQGGLAGTLLFGWLDQNLRPIGDLSNIDGCPSLLGTPALGAGKAAAVTAFAARENEQEPWRVRLARLAPDQPLRVSAEFAHPSEGAGNGAIAPTLTALGSEQWALQWTQGKSGEYRVYVQALAADFTPLGTPTPSSPKGASAGQGSVWVAGERALSLYVLTVGGRDELWGTVLTCR